MVLRSYALCLNSCRPVADYLDETAVQGLKQIHQQVCVSGVSATPQALPTLRSPGAAWAPSHGGGPCSPYTRPVGSVWEGEHLFSSGPCLLAERPALAGVEQPGQCRGVSLSRVPLVLGVSSLRVLSGSGLFPPRGWFSLGLRRPRGLGPQLPVRRRPESTAHCSGARAAFLASAAQRDRTLRATSLGVAGHHQTRCKALTASLSGVPD